VRYARISKSALRDLNARYMAAVRLWALDTMLLLCREGDKSRDTMTPKSPADSTAGTAKPAILKQVLYK